MECNKEEALSSLRLAERKLVERDYEGARQFAFKAQILDPEVEGVEQLLTRISYYENLHFTGFSDLKGKGIVNPDSPIPPPPGFELPIPPPPGFEATMPTGIPTGNPTAIQTVTPENDPSGKEDSTESATKTGKIRIDPHERKPVVGPSLMFPNNGTFWTICPNCGMLFEYQKVLKFCRLICKDCRQTFFANEIRSPVPVPPSGRLRTESSTALRTKRRYIRRDLSAPVLNFNGNHQLQFGTTYRDGNKNEISPRIVSPVRASEADSDGVIFRPEKAVASENPVRVGQSKGKNGAKSDGVTKRRPGRPKKTDKEPDGELKIKELKTRKKLRIGNGAKPLKIQSSDKENSDGNGGFFAKKALKGIDKYMAGTSKNKGKGKLVMQESEKEGEEIDLTSELDEEVPGSRILNPNSTFHNFSSIRKDRFLKEGQVWAAYDNEDKMPRFYVKINKVLSQNPLKMRMSWLNWRYARGFKQHIKWIDSGFSVTSGDFLPAKQEFIVTIYNFSHPMKYTLGANNIIEIYPRKGEVWAMYKNWSKDWNSKTPVNVIREYEFVEILKELSNDEDIFVIPLSQVDGFKYVFRPNDVKIIKKAENLRFSHHVPAYMLSGSEGVNSPAGCWELDPSAVPKEFESNVVSGADPAVQELLQGVVKEMVTGLGKSSGAKGGSGSGGSGAGDGSMK